MLSTIKSVKAADLVPGMLIVTATGDKVWSPDGNYGPWVGETALVRFPVTDLGMGVL